MDILTGFFYLASQIKMIEKILLWKKELKNWKNESPQDIRISVKKRYIYFRKPFNLFWFSLKWSHLTRLKIVNGPLCYGYLSTLLNGNGISFQAPPDSK